MASQLLGVLREVVALESGEPQPAVSAVFAEDGHPFGETDDGQLVSPPWVALPTLRVSPDDPAWATLATLPDSDPAALADLLRDLTPRSTEVELRLARAELEAGLVEVEVTLDAIERRDAWEWRVDWYRGLRALAIGDADGAYEAFDRVYCEVPGEVAPKLALALAAETGGDLAAAAHLYEIVSRTNPVFTSAAFGLARCRLGSGDRAGAVAAYERVPVASGSYVRARTRAARALVGSDGTRPPSSAELLAASRAIEHLPLDTEQRSALTRDILMAALRMFRSGESAPEESTTIFGRPLRERDVRVGLEDAYRTLARYADTRAARVDLIDHANRVRPRSLT